LQSNTGPLLLTGMHRFLAAALALAPFVHAHPDHTVSPGPEILEAVRTGNGGWSYELVPGWGGLPEGKTIGPTHGGVVVVPKSGRVYVSTDGPLSVLVYEADGTFVENIAPDCQGFHAMAVVEEEGKTVLYGAQLNNYGNRDRSSRGESTTPIRVCKIDLDGNLLLEIPNAATGEVEGGWSGLTAVAVAPDGSIFAGIGYGSQKIHKFDPEGRHLKTFGGRGTGDGQFQTCHGLAIDPRFGDPRLLVADRENRRLCHLDLEGGWIGVHATHLRRPCAVSLHGDHLAVAELEARVTILDKNGTPVSFLGDHPDRTKWANFGVPPEEQRAGLFTAPHGLSFDADGHLYVQDWNQTGRVTKLRKL
jgi:hypothetical protein